MIRLLLALAFLFAGSPVMASDEPPHTVVYSQDGFEIRDYEPMIMAEVTVQGSMGRAGNRGFRPLANFIFGDNTAPGGGSGEIAMTTPVTQTRSQQIAMTSPVTQSRSEGEIDEWRIGFVMPADFTLETLPVPNDARIEISERPARRMAAVIFNGGPNERRFQVMEEALYAFLDAQGLEAVGAPVYARYDPPWIPTPFRRNEVMIEIASP